MTPTIAFSVASGFGLCGIMLYTRRKARVRSWRHAKANVIGVRSQSGAEGAAMFAPVFSFAPTPGGDQVTVESRLFCTGRRPEIGQEIDVIFDPANPSSAAIASAWGLYFPAIWCLAVAGMWIIGGVCLQYRILK